jgi:Flp pilus assembly protein TadD
MFQDVSSLLNFQIRRATENGDSEEAMAQLRRFLELERESKLRAQDGQGASNVRNFPKVRKLH